MRVIECQSLSKSYGARRGISGVTIAVESGSVTGFLGPNGAGKTTTLRILVGLLRADQGSARIAMQDAWKDRAKIMREVGYLPGDVRIWTWMKPSDARQWIERTRGIGIADEWARLDQLFQLNDQVPVRDMSRGMRQKLGILMTLAHQPKVIIMDEPTSGLDPIMQQRLMDELRSRAKQGATVLFSSHTLSEVETLCDRIVMVRDGRIICDEQMQDLRKRAARQVVLTWERAPQVPAFDGLTWFSHDSKRWVGEILGSSGELVAWAAERGVLDMTIESPNLGRLFRSFYGGQP